MSAGTGSGPEHALTAAARAVWRWWTRVARRIGEVQARVLLSMFYYTILGPFALVLRRSDPLRIRPGALRGWLRREVVGDAIAEQARRQS